MGGEILHYLLASTTLMAAVLTAWERRFNDAHKPELALWICAYVLAGAGCLTRAFLGPLPGFVAIGLSNLAVLLGYACLAAGAAHFSGRPLSRRLALTLGGPLAILWLGWGQYAPIGMRIVVVSTVAAGLCLFSAAILRARGGELSLPSRTLVLAVFGFHGLFFAVRAVATLAGFDGEVRFGGTNLTPTMFEGVLWSALAPMALLMMVREKTERELLADSQTDYLTGLDNRRAFVRKAEAMLAVEPAAEDERQLALLLFDLDHFKAVNDRHGHQTGDEILKLFGSILHAGIGVRDAASRFGGEEFAVLLPSVGEGEAESFATDVASRLRMATDAMAKLEGPATVSVGLAKADAGTASLDMLIAAADAALYRAKAKGRDRVECAPASLSPAVSSIPHAA